ncbi:MAG: RNA polymerase sigma factor, partial [Eubacterium sp.]
MTQFDYKNHKNLVLKAQEGDSEAFSQLYKLTYKRQYVIIRRFFYNDFIVEDLLQDIYVKLFQTIHSIKNPEYFMAYLNKITYNTCISYKRKSSFKNESTIEDLFFDSIPENNISMMPEDNTLSAECSHSLSEGLKLLSAEERLVFLMRYYDDMRIKHIVEATALSESTVKRRINSAKKILRQYLTAQGIHGFLWAPLAHNMMADAFNATIFDTALEDGVLPNILRATKDTPKPQKIKKETMHLFPK